MKPAGWRASLLLFGVPAVAFYLAYSGLRPGLEASGNSELTSDLTALCVPVAIWR